MFDITGRQAPLETRVLVLATGTNLPGILLSHGHGASNFLSSIRGYSPLVDFYAAHGFVVVQVTHQDSETIGLDPDGPECAVFWRSRPQDLRTILDRLGEIEDAVPGLAGRLDHSKIAVVGHSMGGHTAAMLAGATVTDTHSGEKVDRSDPRISAFIAISPAGGPEGAAEWLRENYPENVQTDYGTMSQPALIIVGDADFNPNFSTQKDWRADAYNQAPGPKTLMTVFAAEHIFGGIPGWDAKETSDENPTRVAEMQRVTWAYVRSALYPEDPAWSLLTEEVASDDDAFAKVERK